MTLDGGTVNHEDLTAGSEFTGAVKRDALGNVEWTYEYDVWQSAGTIYPEAPESGATEGYVYQWDARDPTTYATYPKWAEFGRLNGVGEELWKHRLEWPCSHAPSPVEDPQCGEFFLDDVIEASDGSIIVAGYCYELGGWRQNFLLRTDNLGQTVMQPCVDGAFK